MGYRPRDVCSAAFFNDVPRLRLLVYQDAPGGLEYRFNAARFLATAAAAHSTNMNNAASSGVTPVAPPAAMQGGPPEEGEEEEEMFEFDEELEAALDADSELVRLRKLYTLEEEDIDDEDAAAAAEEAQEGESDDGLYDPEVVEADMAAQEADFARFKALLRHHLREKAMAATVQRHGLLVSGDSAADLTTFGLMFAAKTLASPSHDVHDTSEPAPDASATPLAVRWLPVRNSPYAASPLHWAVLGRAHDAVRFLIANGADAASEVGQLSDKGPTPGAAAFVFPPGLTAERLAEMNAFTETREVLRSAAAARAAQLRAWEHARQQLEGSLELRKARQEKRRLGRDQRRVAREDRNAAAAEEEEENEGDEGEGDRQNNIGGSETDNDVDD